MLKRNNFQSGLACFKALVVLFAMLCSPFSWAGTIQNVSLLDSQDGDVLIIEADEALEYQIFDLNEPPRLVMTFPGAKIEDYITAVKGDGAGVTNLFPMKNELGVRLEVGLSEVLGYEIDEQDQSLIIRFDASEEGSLGAGEQPVIENIKVQDKGDATEVTLQGINMDSSHNAFLTNNNQTLVIDFWGAKSKLKKNRFQYASQRVKAVTVGVAEERLRLIIDLLPVGDMEQQIDASADKMVIRFGAVPDMRSGLVQVESIDFQPEGASAHVMIRTDVTNPVINVHEKDGQTIIDIKKAVLAQGQERTQDLRAFAGPIKQVDAYRLSDKVRVVVRSREKVEISSFQQGNVFTLNFVPESLAAAARGKGENEGEFSYAGEKVTFDFKDIDIRNALKLIAEMSDLNIIMSDDVTGSLTMRLVDVPWDQALELILSARGLGKEQTGTVLRVAPVEVLRAEYESKIEARKGSLQLESLITEFITLSYTKVADVKKMLDDAASNNKSSQTKEGAMPEADSSGLMSSRGSVLVDERTNTLIVKDTQEAINNIKRLIAVIDKPIQQVLIEARIVEASDSFQHSIGVRWGGNYNQQTGADFPGAVALGSPGSTGANADAIISGGIASATGRGMLVDLPAATGPGTGGAIGLSLGSFSNGINLDLELSAAQADGDAKIISNPRVVTSNLKSAKITQGAQIPIVTPGSGNSPATTQLVTAALTLDVTPQITADDGVILDIKVTKDSPTVFNGETGIDSKAVTTNIYVKNGETIVIGGVYSRDKAENSSSVPFLSEIPFLGWMFKNKDIRDNKSELLIFITPKVMQGAAGS
ncbi:MAG: type IV pilus secretin PilQ [Ghiorsea sp.]